MAVDRDGFARALLDVLGAPATPTNVAFLVAWMAREGTSAAFNPLATTLDYGENTKFNSVGVRNYADLATGVEATRRTLTYRNFYAGILADLRAGDGNAAAHQPVELGRWSGGGYDHIDLGPLPPATPPHHEPPKEISMLIVRRASDGYEALVLGDKWIHFTEPADVDAVHNAGVTVADNLSDGFFVAMVNTLGDPWHG